MSLSIDVRTALFRTLLRDPRPTRWLRRTGWRPKLGGMRWITRHADVIAILARDREFGVPYLPKMEHLDAQFLLGFDHGEAYRHQRALLDRSVPHTHALEIGARTLAAAAARLEGVTEFDLVGELVDPVLADVIEDYMGAGRPDFAAIRAVFADIFINSLDDPRVTSAAEDAAVRLRAGVEARVRAGAAGDGDALSRLLAATDDERTIVDNLMGLTIAWATSVSRTAAFAVNVLLDDAAALAEAQAAARAGDGARVRALLFAALREYPSAPAVERVCTRETRYRGARVKRGEKLLVVLSSAMADDPAADLHFGHGMHTCYGAPLSRAQLEAFGLALLRGPRLARSGPLELAGPYPKALRVQFASS